MHGSWGLSPFFWMAWWLIPLALLALFAFGRGWRNRHHRWNGGSDWGDPSSHQRALAILQERFARGEIDEDEFLRRRATLDAQ